MVSRLLAIIGPHRSGTSATAGGLAHLGFPVGPRPIMAPSPANPRGYWEPLPVVHVHDRLLRGLGTSWDLPRPLPRSHTQTVHHKAAVLALQAMLASLEPYTVVKDPRMCLFPDLWAQAALRAGVKLAVLSVQRPMGACTVSLARRESWPLARAESVWARYKAGQLCWQSLPDVQWSLVDYGRLLQDPWQELTGALGRVGVTPPCTADVDQHRLRAFVDPELNHA